MNKILSNRLCIVFSNCLIISFIVLVCVKFQENKQKKLDQSIIAEDYNAPKLIYLSLSTDKPVYFMMEPIWITVTNRNDGNEELSGFGNWYSGWHPFVFRAYDNLGKELPLTDYGRTYRNFAESSNKPNKPGPLTDPILPGKSESYKIMINRFIDFTNVAPQSDFFIEVQRLQSVSNRLKINVLRKEFDLSDKGVKEALKSGSGLFLGDKSLG